MHCRHTVYDRGHRYPFSIKILPPKTNSELQESKKVTEGEELNSKGNVEETSLEVEVGVQACEKDANTVSLVSQNIKTFYFFKARNSLT